jgi:hypothetical protein
MVRPENANPATPTQVLAEFEGRYNKGKLETSEYAALRDHANYLDALHYAKVTDREPAHVERVIETIYIAEKRKEAGVYGKKGEKVMEVGLHLGKLMEAYRAEGEGTSHAGLIEKVARPLHRIIDRLENPTSQPSQDTPTNTSPKK